ncbi:hypothetical protein [Deinococcus fonticola]|uniref:hypothetical protein n=1 Tax=Deinococcus fonticola TaxID=2528713 RepID=UPI001074BF98|nr:hypothetical protein [Deinococcus fonticola]
MSPSIPVPTALGRVIDLKYPSNRWAVLGSLGAAAAARAAGCSWAGSLRVGLAGFAAWALARELDPDAPRSANLALPLAALATWQAGEESDDVAELAALLPAFTSLAGLRFATESTGDAPRWYDSLALTGATAATGQAGDHASALLPALAVAASLLARDGLEPPAWLAPLLAAAALVPQVWPDALHLPERRDNASAALAGAALLLSPFLLPREGVDSETDNGQRRLSPERLQAARLVVLTGVGLGVAGGQAPAAIPLAAASLMIGLRRALRA